MSERPIVIFGCESFASLVYHCITGDGLREVVGFTVDAAYKTKDAFEGVPVVPFEDVESEFPPARFDMIIAVGAVEMNAVRRSKFDAGRSRGYHMVGYVSSTTDIGREVALGEHCLIFGRAVIESGVRLGSNVYIRSGVTIGHHSTVGAHCFIAAGCVTGGNVSIGERCFLGLGSIIRDNVSIADRCLIGAGAVVVKDTEPDGVYLGIPARRGEQLSSTVM